MARKYQVNFMVRFINRIIAGAIRGSKAPPNTYLLTVQGRKSGKPYSVPVYLIERGEQRWLVSPYGEVNWVKNARLTGEVSLFRDGVTESAQIQELPAQDSAPILKEYLTKVAIVRPYFEVKYDASLEKFSAEAPRHPVFLLRKKREKPSGYAHDTAG